MTNIHWLADLKKMFYIIFTFTNIALSFKKSIF